MLGPADGATVETPVLAWASVPGIGKYKVTLDKPGSSMNLTVTTAATTWTPTSEVANSLPAGPVTWWVQTVDSHGELSIVGDQRIFNLDPATTGATLVLLTPSDGADGLRMPSMTWTPYTGAEYYEVWYSVEGSGRRTSAERHSGAPVRRIHRCGRPADPG